MKLQVIFSTLLFFISVQFVQAQGGIFGQFEKAFEDISETFTGDKAEAAAAKRKADAQKAIAEHEMRQEELRKIADLEERERQEVYALDTNCLLYTSPSPRDLSTSRMPSSA